MVFKATFGPDEVKPDQAANVWYMLSSQSEAHLNSLHGGQHRALPQGQRKRPLNGKYIFSNTVYISDVHE